MDELDVLAGVAPAVDEDAVMEQVGMVVAGHSPVQAWEISNEREADWALRKLAEIEERRQRYRDEVSRWQDAMSRIGRGAAWLEERLQAWALRERTTKIKSFPLAHGRVATRTTPARIVVQDEEVALAWAERECPEAVKVTKSFLVSAAKDQGVRIGSVAYACGIVEPSTGEIVATVEVTDSMSEEEISKRYPDKSLVWEVQPAVVTREGRRVPGLSVQPEVVTASVTPLAPSS